MKRRLFSKFLLAYLIFGVLGFAFVALISSEMTYRYLIREQAENLYSEATLIASTYSKSAGNALSEELVNGQIHAVSAFLKVRIWIVDSNGLIVSDDRNTIPKGTAIPEFDPARITSRRFTVGRFQEFFQNDVLTVMAPVNRSYSTIGYVLIHCPLENILSSQYRILNIVYITSLIIFLLSGVILIVFYFIVYRPLSRITIGAMKFAEGNYAYRIDCHAQDEMGYLAATLNYMSDEIAKADDYQRQFIANVSHDFRSPLTSIKGYLEAILDGTIPRELENKYLQRLISETDRLTKLTQSMLSLDSNGFLTKSNFDINRMIRDICSSFEINCQKKGIVFELTFAERMEMVHADYAKIQQVLYNLIDNALKFSNENTAINIRTGQKGNKVFISVKDSGIGIPKKDISKIWDRFYKADQSRGKDKHGTGLGLAIVKSIISSHGENIDCISTEGVGTEFIFTLPPGSTR